MGIRLVCRLAGCDETKDRAGQESSFFCVILRASGLRPTASGHPQFRSTLPSMTALFLTTDDTDNTDFFFSYPCNPWFYSVSAFSTRGRGLRRDQRPGRPSVVFFLRHSACSVGIWVAARHTESSVVPIRSRPVLVHDSFLTTDFTDFTDFFF